VDINVESLLKRLGISDAVEFAASDIKSITVEQNADAHTCDQTSVYNETGIV
jgi:hypothetical protein